MKHFLAAMLSAACFVVLNAAGVAAFDNEPEGFRGVKWGSELSTLSGFRKVLGAGDTVFYAREGEKEGIGAASVASIRYLFYKGQLRQVWIMAEGAGNFAALQSALFEAFGKPVRVDSHDGSSEWIGARTTIMLSAAQSSEKEKMEVMLIFTDTGFLGTGTKEKAKGGAILKDF